MVILDTSIVIDHLRHKVGMSSLESIVQKHSKETLAVSVITVQELYEGKSTKEEEKEKQLLATISPLRILPYTYDVAELAGKIARDLPRPIELADAAIAASSIINNSSLYTLNKNDFIGIPDIELLDLKLTS